jgi:acyl dehydratase
MSMSATETAVVPAAPVALVEGDTLSLRVGPLGRTDFVRYAGASGDFHPLHHDEVYAREAGFPSVFGMGLLHGGILGLHLARWVGPVNIRTFSIRFTGQVWPGDELEVTAQVDRVREIEGVRVADLRLAVTRQTGDEAIRGSAVAVVA